MAIILALPGAHRRDKSNLVSRLYQLVGILLDIDVFTFKADTTTTQYLLTDARVSLLKQRVELGQWQGRREALGVFGRVLGCCGEIVDGECSRWGRGRFFL